MHVLSFFSIAQAWLRVRVPSPTARTGQEYVYNWYQLIYGDTHI